MGWGKDENDTMLWDLKTQSTSNRSNLVSQICLAKSHVPKDGVEQRLDFANPLRKHHIISTTWTIASKILQIRYKLLNIDGEMNENLKNSRHDEKNFLMNLSKDLNKLDRLLTQWSRNKMISTNGFVILVHNILFLIQSIQILLFLKCKNYSSSGTKYLIN